MNEWMNECYIIFYIEMNKWMNSTLYLYRNQKFVCNYLLQRNVYFET
jgi:hypothetical protein